MTDPFDTVKEWREQFIAVTDPLDVWLCIDGNYVRPATKQESEMLTALASIEERLREAEWQYDTDGRSVHLLNSFYENLVRDAKRAEAAEQERDKMAMLLDGQGWKKMPGNYWERQRSGGTALESAVEQHKARAEAAERERDALQHIIDCADTPLMRDVLRERDDLKRRWEEGNTCGICPYRISIQARVAELEAALREIANRTHPATYLGKREDGVEMYGGSDDASRFARAALASGKPS